MMANDLLRYLVVSTFASSLAIVAVMTIRLALRRIFGALAAYSAWLLLPIALVAICLPHVQYAGAALSITLDFNSQAVLGHALGASFGSSLGARSSLPWPAWALGVWIVGAALCASYLAGVQRAFVMSLGVLSGPRSVLRAQHTAGCPALLGVIRPKIVLPADFDCRYTRLERLLIFSHERTHLRRGDAAWNALAAFLRCLFWFNPLTHLASTYFRVDQELACDAAVMREHPHSGRTYASAMLKTELTDAALPLGCHWNSAHQFKARLRMLKRPIPGSWRRLAGYVCVTLTSVIVAYSAWATEPVSQPPKQTASDAAAVHVVGHVYVVTVDDRRFLIGVSGNVGGQIDHLFLYTSQGSTGMKLTLQEAPSTIDYQPRSGLRFTIPDRGEKAEHGLAFYFSAGGGVSMQADNSRAVPLQNQLGVSLGLSHYWIRPALSVSAFSKLHKIEKCNRVESPCIQAAGQLLEFPG
jgi:beta-lactamase regulating signal transducer with metallopeptidase domain